LWLFIPLFWSPVKRCLLRNYLLIYALIVLCACSGKKKDKDPIVAITPADSLSNAQKLSPAEFSAYQRAVRQFYDSAFRKGRFNGSILVAKNGEIIFEEYNGFRHPRVKKDSITPNTSFHLASVSKTFTAMAALKLAEEGRLNINDTISKYLDSFPVPGVTIKTLMNHRSGLPNYVHYMEELGWDKKQPVTNQAVLDFIVNRHKEIQIGRPDRRFSYSNTNYALLALVIEKVSGMSFAQYMKMAFFDPLDMKDTYVFTMADSARSLPSYFNNGRQYAFDFLDQVYGDKNIYSTARDLLKWDQALQNGLFSKQTIDAAYTPYSFEKPGINNYGLGWRMFVLKNGKKFIYHNGWWHGYRTAFYRLVEENVTIIALSNNDYKRVYSAKKIADIFGRYFSREEERNSNAITSSTRNASGATQQRASFSR
jgi:CubicO group peptidase (beta-lactamase class C family)